MPPVKPASVPCTSATVASRSPSTPRIEDLAPFDFLVVECHSCKDVGLLSGRFLLSLGFPPYTSIKNLQRHTRCRGCGVHGKGDISIKRGKEVA
jgi:hypothetical protein